MRGCFVCAETTGLAGREEGAIVDLHIRKELGRSGGSLNGPARWGDSHLTVSIHYGNRKSSENWAGSAESLTRTRRVWGQTAPFPEEREGCGTRRRDFASSTQRRGQESTRPSISAQWTATAQHRAKNPPRRQRGRRSRP